MNGRKGKEKKNNNNHKKYCEIIICYVQTIAPQSQAAIKRRTPLKDFLRAS